SCLLVVVLTRASFHLAWFLMWVVLALYPWPDAFLPRWRPILATITAPIVIAIALYAKNLTVFGTPTSSSWLGMNLANLILKDLGPQELARLRKARVISELGTYLPFLPLDNYPSAFVHRACGDAPVLAMARKHGGAINFNHCAYVSL